MDVGATATAFPEDDAGLACHGGEECLALWRLAGGHPDVAAATDKRMAQRPAAQPPPLPVVCDGELVDTADPTLMADLIVQHADVQPTPFEHDDPTMPGGLLWPAVLEPNHQPGLHTLPPRPRHPVTISGQPDTNPSPGRLRRNQPMRLIPCPWRHGPDQPPACRHTRPDQPAPPSARPARRSSHTPPSPFAMRPRPLSLVGCLDHMP